MLTMRTCTTECEGSDDGEKGHEGGGRRTGRPREVVTLCEYAKPRPGVLQTVTRRLAEGGSTLVVTHETCPPADETSEERERYEDHAAGQKGGVVRATQYYARQRVSAQTLQ